MNRREYQEHPFGIVKKFVASESPLDNCKILQWMDVAQYMGYELYIFDWRNWVGSGRLVDGGDVLTLPFEGRWDKVAASYKLLRTNFLVNVS